MDQKCRRCGETKSINDFYINHARKNDHETICKECRREDFRIREKRRGPRNRAKRKSFKHNKFGNVSTLVIFNKLFDTQNGRCAICGRHQSEFKVSLSVDHDHSTQKVRGLLCYSCNYLLGFAKDDPDILNNAIVYLQKYSK